MRHFASHRRLMNFAKMNLLLSSLLIFLQSSSLFGSSVIDCNFDQSGDTCGWTDLSGNSWVRTKSSAIDPGHDHTCIGSLSSSPSKPCGYWLSTLPSANYTGTQEFTLVSKLVSSTSGPYCLRFWYHFFGLEKAQFDVEINGRKNAFNARTIWSKITPQSNNWIQGYVDIPPQSSSFYLLFHALLTAKYHDTAGVDDITLNFGACPPTPDCDLENGLCSWTSQGATLKNGTPIVDHTMQSNFGHYLLSPGNGQKSVISASIKNLTTIFVNNNYLYCFKFWYYFLSQPSNGDTESYILLNVTNYPYGRSKTLSIQDVNADGLLNQWKPLFFSLPNPHRGYLTKELDVVITLYGKGNTQIAIDDLVVSNDMCETLGECDFESDFCGWSNAGKFLWLRNTGGNQNSLRKAPPTDTTTHTVGGWFAMVPLEYIKAYYQATLESPPLNSESVGNCFSFNFWAIGSEGTPALMVTFTDLTKFNQKFATVYANASSVAMWRRFHYKLSKMPLRFTITIQTSYSASRLTSDIAIDDILWSSFPCRTDHPVTNAPTPVPIVERKWNCNFEYSCQWAFDTNYWQVTSYRKVSGFVNAPRSDHTYKTPEGRYLLYMPSSQLAPNQTSVVSIINSTALTDRQHCLSFWYYDTSEILFTLGVYIRAKQFVAISRTIRPNVATRSWKMVKVDLWAYYPNTYVQLNFTTNSFLNGSFAIDDIQIVPGACKHIDDYVYTFDSMDNLELSRISPLNGFMGTIHYNDDRRFQNAPIRDHTSGTGGYFLFMNRPTDYNTTYQDLLVLDNLPKMRFDTELSDTRCFRFAYQIYGNASLSVYINPVDSNSYDYPIFTAYAYHTSWMIAQVPYSAYYQHKLTFEMTKPFDSASYIAIDDISVSNHNCKQAVECDFDDDTCSYTSRYLKADYDFGRFVGPPSNASWPGPAFDHTKRGWNGGYLYMTGYPNTVNRTRYSAIQTPIESNRYTISSNYCISFWTQLTAADAELSFILGLYGGSGLPSGVPKIKMYNLVTLSNLTQSKWTWYSVDIDKHLFGAYHEFNLQISGSTNKANTVIAIDDIELARTSCDFGFRFSCHDGTVIDANLLCNFKADCAQGEDETNCGQCDFENGSCGWLNQGSYGYYSIGRWTLTSAKSSSGPKTDGNGNSNGHYLLLNKSYGNTSIFIAGTKLSRDYRDYKTQFKDAYFTCTMTFDYLINSNRPKYSAAVLEVYAGSDVDSAVLKAYYAVKSNSWQKGIAYIGGFTGSFVVQFMGSRMAINETVALDNFQFHNCSFPNPIGPNANCRPSVEVLCKNTRLCIDAGDLCDFEDNCGDNWDENYAMCASSANPGVVPSCAFEQSLEFCGFTMEPSSNLFNWQFSRGQPYNVMGYSGPGADHTTKDKTGQFLMLKSYNKEYMGQRARLYSPFMYSKGGPCWLRFFYYNNGNASLGSFNSLSVWVEYADGRLENSGIKFSSNTYMAYWLKAKVKYSSSSPFRFVIDGQLADRQGSISLDDVSFLNTCMYSPQSKRTTGSHSSAAVPIILVLLTFLIVGGLGYFLFRKHQTGQLTPYIERVSSMLPRKKGDQLTVVNVNYKEEPSTSTST